MNAILIDAIFQTALLILSTSVALLLSRSLLSFIGMYTMEHIVLSMVLYSMVGIGLQLIYVFALHDPLVFKSIWSMLEVMIIFFVAWTAIDMLFWKFFNKGLHPRRPMNLGKDSERVS